MLMQYAGYGGSAYLATTYGGLCLELETNNSNE